MTETRRLNRQGRALKCPKCGHTGEPRKRYVERAATLRAHHVAEHIAYHCGDCGYEITTVPTNDHD